MYRCLCCAQSFSSFFLLGKINRWNCKGPHMQSHTACALGRMEDMRSRGGLPNKKAVQRSSAGRWWDRNHLQFTRSVTEHNTMKPVPLTQMLKLVMPSFCIKYEGICLILTIHSSWHWHGIWQLFMLVSWLSWWRKTWFFPSCMQYRWDSAKAAPAANNSTLTAGVTVNMWRTWLGCIYLSSAAQLGLPLRWETA